MKKIIIILFSIFFIAGCTNGTQDINHFEKGQDYLKELEYDEALNEFQLASSQSPSEENSYLAIAEIYTKKGNNDKALEILKNAYVNIESENISNAIGQIYINIGDLNESIKWYETTLQKNSNNHDAIKGKIKLLSLNNDVDGVKTYMDGLDNEKFDSEILIMKSIVNLDDTKEASRLMLLSNTVDDRNVDLSVELRLAIIAYENAKTVHNLSEIIYILLNYGWYEIAQLPVSKVHLDNPFYETGYIYQALINIKTLQLDKAIENLSKVEEINPDNIDVEILRIQILTLKQEIEIAENALNELIIKDNLELTNGQYSTIQQMLYQQGKFEQIEMLHTKNKDKLEFTPETQLLYVDSLLRLNKFNQAEQIIFEINSKDVVLATPLQAKLKTFEAVVNYELDKKQQGIDMITEAENIDNAIPIIHYYKGVLLNDMGRPSEAKLAFDRAVELDLIGDITDLVNNITEGNNDE